ncbi:MAG: hypothetical protein N3F63_04385 [Thermoplasmata archaeon]|nr:hypothetical protein [Thermoplasmata archaeon]
MEAAYIQIEEVFPFTSPTGLMVAKYLKLTMDFYVETQSERQKRLKPRRH